MPKKLLENIKEETLSHFEIWELIKIRACLRMEEANSTNCDKNEFRVKFILGEFKNILISFKELFHKCLTQTEDGFVIDNEILRMMDFVKEIFYIFLKMFL